MLKEFIHVIKEYSDLIREESSKSWEKIKLNQNEPNIILDYLTKPQRGVDYLNSKIASVITSKTNFEMKFASIYCHQKPRVERTSENIKQCKGDNKSEKCELGDLAIHFLLLDKNKKVKFSNAVILQAKKGLKSDNLTQQCLYENDDCLIFPKYFGNINEKCDLPKYEESRANAFAYLFLNKNKIGIGQIPLKNKLFFSWSVIFQRLMTNEFGKAYNYSEIKFKNDWDKLISNLILNLSSTTLKKGENRVNGLEYILNKFNYYYYYPEYKLEVENESIPSILIIVRNKEK
jgi:hypothetical protein